MPRAGLGVFETPEEAVDGFVQSCRHRQLRDALAAGTPAAGELPEAALGQVRSLVAAARSQHRQWLTEPEAKAVLSACGIPVVATPTARDVDEALRLAAELGWPVALKILSPDITHKADVGGVALNLVDAAGVEAAALTMLEAVRRRCPGARIEGFAVQQMVDRSQAQELILGIATDATFGRCVLFGAGGSAVEVLADRSLELLPLNRPLAAALIGRTRVRRLLRWLPRSPAGRPGRTGRGTAAAVATGRGTAGTGRTGHQSAAAAIPAE